MGMLVRKRGILEIISTVKVEKLKFIDIILVVIEIGKPFERVEVFIVMKKIMFDSNAFSSLINSEIDWTDFFEKYESEYEFYVTAIQVEELSEIPDSKMELRIQHMLCLCKMKAKLVPNIAVIGYGRFGFSIFAEENDTTYEDLLFENRRNVKDAIIGEAAKREGCILVSDDADFIKKLNNVGIPTMTFNEFEKDVNCFASKI